MNNIKKQLILSCAAIGFSSFALLANAQDPWTICKDQPNKEECRAAKIAQFKAERDVRQAKLHDELKITAKQESAWQAFTNSNKRKDINSEGRKEFSRADLENMSAPQRLERKIARMEKHEAAMKTKLVALKKLYAVLTPEQQTILNTNMQQFEKNRHHRHGDRKQNQSSENTDQGSK